MKLGILGAGLSGLSLAWFLERKNFPGTVDLLEKEGDVGGLCRSFSLDGLPFDIGPHILFSRDREMLSLILEFLGDNSRQLRRSNRILHGGRLIKYPFENELSALPEADRDYCLNAFLNNPYEGYPASSMLQFFLVTFGEGITNTYLRPYNQKIWKFDPAFMDTQMVERIPKPPREDVIRSAEGIATEGYTHQLHFHYPRREGIAALVHAIRDALTPGRTTIHTGAAVTVVRRKRNDGWVVTDAGGGERLYDRLVSTVPLPELASCLGPSIPRRLAATVNDLKYNSIAISVMKFRQDRIGDHFAVNVPDSRVIFHRLSRLNFLCGDQPPAGGGTTLMMEVTYRRGDLTDRMDDRELEGRIRHDLQEIGFTAPGEECLRAVTMRFPYAYVIYDLHHRRRMAAIRRHLEGKLGLVLCGRFGEFEYLNMDAVLRNSLQKADLLAAG